MQGQLWVIAAPSGAGKTTLVTALLDKVDNLAVSISYTTREPKAKEQQGKDYFFVNEAEFQQMIKDQALLEYATVFNHYYGTGKAWVAQELAAGTDIILEIDWQGAAQIRHLLPQSRSIFILPPSMEALQQRSQQRGRDAPEVMQQRLQEASKEMSHCGEFDYIVVNDDFELALSQLAMIIQAQRLIAPRQVVKNSHLLQEL